MVNTCTHCGYEDHDGADGVKCPNCDGPKESNYEMIKILVLPVNAFNSFKDVNICYWPVKSKFFRADAEFGDILRAATEIANKPIIAWEWMTVAAVKTFIAVYEEGE